ncbi:MAG: 2-oxopent-4-enoate hydratase [Shewanella sp.]|nr:2-oxopent-4-enoate hydratase [Shewanella sp.]
MNSEKLEQLGLELYQALRNQTSIPSITDREPSFNLDDAYKVSQHFLQHRLNDGERIVGKKIGLTSKVVQQMLKVHQPDFGFLTDTMIVESGKDITFSQPLIQAKSEGEIAFILKRDLRGPNVTPQDVIDATESVAACFEIVDSRIKDWKIKIEDTVADNASCGMFVMGKERVSPKDVDFENCQMVIKNKGQVVATGQGSAALGSPLNCVAWLANTLGQYDITLNAGDIILSGSLAAMIPCQQGDDMSVEIEGIGSAHYRLI